ncbi:MAG: hypothetical protein ACFFCI_22435 [Promethearchaeota archaeon]
MKYELVDAKLKSLIRVCKETQNYKKLAVVSFILTSNLLDEIGIKLGIRPRDNNMGETLLRYIKLINSVLLDNFNVVLFREEVTDTLKVIEPQFLEREGDIPFGYIIEMFTLYYNLRKLDIPNLHSSYESEFNVFGADSQLSSLLSLSSHQNENHTKTQMKPLLLHKLKEQRYSIQNKLRKTYDKTLFENVIYLKKAEEVLKKDEKGKIEVKGRLRDNINYKRSMDEIVGYGIFSVFFVFFLIGLAITIEAVFYPHLTASLGLLLLITFGVSVLFFMLYWHYFRKGGSQ